MGYFILGIYFFIILLHIVKGMNGQKNWIFIIATFGFIYYLCGHCNYKSIYDLANYQAYYNYYDPMIDESFGLYYVFFILVKLGQICGLSFVTWWHLTLAFFFLLIVIALYIHDINPHQFLAVFMSYYVFVYYTGLKFFYAFAVYMIAFGFLLKPGKKNKMLYILFTVLAGGIHVMYYIYLIFAFSYKKLASNEEGEVNLFSNKKVMMLIVATSLFVSAILRINGTASLFLSRIFSFMESDKIDLYLTLSTKLGFYIPVVLQLLALYVTYKYRKMMKNVNNNRYQYAEILFYTNLLQILFYPLFMVSITFTRLITSASLVTISATGYKTYELWQNERIRIVGLNFLIVFAFIFRNFVLGNLWNISVVPLFNL